MQDESTSTKVIVKLNNRTMLALEAASAAAHLNSTDTINRGIQVYAYLLAKAGKSMTLAVMDDNGKSEILHL